MRRAVGRAARRRRVAPRALPAAELPQLVEAFVRRPSGRSVSGSTRSSSMPRTGTCCTSSSRRCRTAADDAYGGSLENRCASRSRSCERVREVWPLTARVVVRVSATDWVDGGWDIDQTLVARRRAATARSRLDRRVERRRLAAPVRPGRARVPGAARRGDPIVLGHPHDRRRAHHRAASRGGDRRLRPGRHGRAGTGHALRPALGLARGGRAGRDRLRSAAVPARPSGGLAARQLAHGGDIIFSCPPMPSSSRPSGRLFASRRRGLMRNSPRRWTPHLRPASRPMRSSRGPSHAYASETPRRSGGWGSASPACGNESGESPRSAGLQRSRPRHPERRRADRNQECLSARTHSSARRLPDLRREIWDHVRQSSTRFDTALAPELADLVAAGRIEHRHFSGLLSPSGRHFIRGLINEALVSEPPAATVPRGEAIQAGEA